MSNPAVIRVVGAREHNLRDVSLELAKNNLICLTGVSGSGKSSLAFDTLHAEGQRRYVESLSSYARQFIGQLPKPNVDQITGLAPSISIQQKTGGWNPRSTVGTITQIHDFLRVLYARAGAAHCVRCGQPVTAQTREHMLGRIFSLPAGTGLMLLAPKVRAQKGEHRDLLEDLLRQGFTRARVDRQLIETDAPVSLDRNRRHDIDVVIDRIVLQPAARSRLAEALDLALSAGAGAAIVAPLPENAGKKRDAFEEFLLSSGYACTACGVSYAPPEPQLFSFNSPQGMCPACDGLGDRFDFDEKLLVPDSSLNFLHPCITAFRTPPGRWRRHIYEGVARHVGFDLRAPWGELPSAARKALLHGTGPQPIVYEWRSRHGVWKHAEPFEGVLAELRAKHRKATSAMVRRFYEQFMRQAECSACKGARLNPQALAVRLTGKRNGERVSLNIHELDSLAISEAMSFLSTLELDPVQRIIAAEPLKELRARLGFLLDVGLDYLALGRSAPSLSGGESQRIRLAGQIGSGLVGVLYVLDEPSIGLHPRDNRRLLTSLLRLRDAGNTVVVVEHDRDTMEAADQIVDFGPGAGSRGGEVVAQGTLQQVMENPSSLTGAYLSGRAAIEVPRQRRPVTAYTPPSKPSTNGEPSKNTRSRTRRR